MPNRAYPDVEALWKHQTAADGSRLRPTASSKPFLDGLQQQTAAHGSRARLLCKQEVAGSSPAGSIGTEAGCRAKLEHG